MRKFYKKFYLVCCFIMVALLPITAEKAVAQVAFTPGNIAVYRLGNGNTLSSAATQAYIDEYTTSGTFVQTIAMPTTGSGRIVNSGSATSEGFLTLSQDSTYLTNAGYDAAVGTLTIASTASSSTARVSDTINILGIVDRAVSTTGYTANNMRAVVKGNGNDYWAGGPGGTPGDVAYLGYANAATTLNGTNTRVIQIFNGNIYFSSGSSPVGIYQFTGTPTSGTPTVTGVVTSGTSGFGTSPYGFSVNPSGTTIYVADDVSGNGITKYTLSGGVWSKAYTFLNISRSLVVDWSGANPVIYAVAATSTGPGSILKITDNGTLASSTTSTIITNAASNGVYRGIAFTPTCVTPYIASSGSTTICAGSSVMLNASLITIPSGITYSWTNSAGTVVSTNPTYSASTADNYTLTIASSGCGPRASAATTITVNPVTVINNQSYDKKLWVGDNTTLNVAATGTAITYQWQYSTGGAYTNVPAAAPYGGTTSSTLSISSVTAAMNGYKYQCVVTGTCGTLTSTPNTLNIYAVPTITGTACPGSTIALSGTFNPSRIIWNLNGSTVQTTNASYIPSAGVTIAGTGVSGSGATQMALPSGIFVDATGNIYVADEANHRVQKFAPGSTTGVVVAGTGVAGSSASQLNTPTGVFVDGVGNLYVSDAHNYRIQKFAPGSTTGATVAGTGVAGLGATQLNNPYNVYVDATGNMYVADGSNNRVQKFAPGSLTGVTVAGSSTGLSGTAATLLTLPTYVYGDAYGNLYVSDYSNNRIQEFAPGSTTGVTVAGSSTGAFGSSATLLSNPRSIYVDGLGNLFVDDRLNNRIQKFVPGSTIGVTVAGSSAGTSGNTAALLNFPTGLYVDDTGNIYTSDENNFRIQKFSNNITTTYAPTVAGTYTAIPFAGDSTNITTASFVVNPNVGTPAFTPGPATTRCQGAGTITYAATASNSTSITYSLDAASISGGNTIVATTGAVTYSSTWSGTTVITASAAGCSGPVTSTFTVTVTPSVVTPVFTPGPASTRCQGAGTITYGATATNSTSITYLLDAASISGGNTIVATTGAVTYSSTWSGTTVITASAAGCSGPVTSTFTVIVTPTVVTPVFTPGPAATRCQGAGTITYAATATNSTSITYSLDAASTSGGNTIVATTGAVTYSATWSGTTVITASAAGCSGPVTSTFTVTVTPSVVTPVFTPGPATTRCQGAGTITYGATATNSTSITYSLDAASISGGNTIVATTGAVTYSSTWSGTTVITASAAGCSGPVTSTFTVIVTPTVVTPVFTPGPAATRCQGAGTITYAATATNTTGITYSLDAASITGGNTIVATSGAVTYSSTWSGTTIITATATGCSGPVTSTFNVTITPTVGTPIFTPGPATTRCQGGGTITYTATATNNTGITYSLDAASVTGGNTIVATTGAVTYSATWSGTTVITASAAGCNGPTTSTFTVIVTPSVVTPVFTPGPASTRCQGAGTITYAATATNSTSITYSLDAASISGGNTIVATSGAVTYSATWSGTTVITASAAGCNGPLTSTFIVTVTPTVGTPIFTPGPASTRCQGPTTITYAATAANNTGIVYTLDAASVTGGNTIVANTGAVTYSSTWSGTTVITATATGCNGPSAANFTVIVKPLPNQPATFTASTATVCQGQTNVIYTVPNDATVTYNWSYTGAGATITGTGNSVLVNYNTTATSGNIQVTATANNGCGVSSPQVFAVTVNPLPLITVTPSAVNVCNNAPETISISSSVTNTIYSWTNTLPSTGAPAAGIASSIPFTALNGGIASITDTIIVIPTANSCTGPTQKAYVIVNPTPVVTAIPLTQTVCNGIATNISFSSNVTTGVTSYSWTNNMSAIGLLPNGTGNVNFNSTNTSSTPDTASIIVTPIANGCPGQTKTATIIVTPLPTVNVNRPSQSVCTGSPTAAIIFSTTVPGTIFTWVNTNTATGVPSNGIGNVASVPVTTNTTSSPLTSTITVTPIISGCAGTTQQATVTVNPYPQAIVIASNGTTSCVNDSVVLHTNTGSGYIYQWIYNGSPIFSATNPVYAAHVTGYYSVSVSSLGCLSTSTQTAVLVKAIPSAPIYNVGGMLTHCVGDSALLGTATSVFPPYTYQWQHNGTDVSGATNVWYTAASPGTYDVKVTGNGCSNTSAILTVVENPNPAIEPIIAASTVVCPGGTDVLHVDPLNNTYQWYSNNNLIPGASNAQYSATATGIYTVGITNSFGCTTFSLPLSLPAGIAPTLNVALQNKQLCVQGSGYTNFQWYLNGVAITNATGACYDPGTQAGGYTVSASNAGGCTGTSATFYYSTGVNNITPAAIKLYPNPAINVVNISAPEAVNVTINSMDGKQLMYVGDAKTIDISKLADAVYLMKVYDTNNTLVKVEKLVKAGW